MNKQNNLNQNKGSIYSILPLLCVLLLVPIIVKGVSVTTHLSRYVWYGKQDQLYDIFTKAKVTVLLVFGILMIAQLAFTFYQSIEKMQYHTGKSNRFPKNNSGQNKFFVMDKGLYLLIVYVLLAVLSTCMAKDKQTVLKGFPEQYESIWVLITYAILVFYCYYMVKTKQQLHLIHQTIACMVGIIGSIGMLQAIGYDPLQSPLIQAIISNRPLSFVFNKGHVYGTLYNPNYVGVFTALLTPFVLFLCIASKTLWKRMLYLGLVILLVVNNIFCQSSSGTVGLLASCILIGVIVALLYWKQYKRYLKRILTCIILVLLALVLGNMSMGNPIGEKITNTIASFTDESRNRITLLSRIDTNDTCVRICYNDRVIQTMLVGDESQYAVLLLDETGKEYPVTLSEDASYITIEDPSLSTLRFSLAQTESGIAIRVDIDGVSWGFTNQTDGTYYFVNPVGKLVKLHEEFKANNFYQVGSSRGYIWSKAVDVIRNHPLLGTGPDSFGLYFPNTDYINMRYYGFDNQIVSKPHNLYLQIASQTGIPSLFAFLAFYLYYMICMSKTILKAPKNSYTQFISIGLLSGTFGYMISGLANDSHVSVAPLYWCFIGIGFSINRMQKQTQDGKQ